MIYIYMINDTQHNDIYIYDKSISVSKFTHTIFHSRLISHPPLKLSDLVDADVCNTTLSNLLLDAHAAIKTKTIRAKPVNKWFTPALSTLKSARRPPHERLWLRTRLSHQLKLLRTATNKYHSAIIDAMKRFKASLVSSSFANTRKI